MPESLSMALPPRQRRTGAAGVFANPRYRGQLADCRAGAVGDPSGRTRTLEGPALLSRNPYADFARAAALFETAAAAPAGMHPSAVIADDAVVDSSAHIGAHVSIGARSRIEAGAVIGPGCVIGEDCVVGRDSRLVSRVSLVCRVRIGARVIVHPGPCSVPTVSALPCMKAAGSRCRSRAAW